MFRARFAVLAAALGVCSLSPRAALAAATQSQGFKNHTHANAQSEGGSSLRPAVLVASTATVQGPFQQNGSRHKISSGAFIVDGAGATITLPAGSIAFSAISGGSGVGGCTTVSGNASNANFDVCVATVSVTPTGGRLSVGFRGGAQNASGNGVALYILNNGRFYHSAANVPFLSAHLNAASSVGQNFSFNEISSETFTGAQDFCIGFAGQSGANWIVPAAATSWTTPEARFCVGEVK